MSKIRIVAVPPGFARHDIREQWVGIVIPLLTQEQLERNPPSGMSIGSANRDGYIVLLRDAIKALRDAQRVEAAQYWEELRLGTYLRFAKEVCEVIE